MSNIIKNINNNEMYMPLLSYLHPACRMSFKNMREYLAWLYYQYLLITGIYVLEPWEKSIFNSVFFSAIAMVIYTSYVFVPIHVRLALEFFSGIFGGQPASTVALMNWDKKKKKKNGQREHMWTSFPVTQLFCFPWEPQSDSSSLKAWRFHWNCL